MGYMGRYQICLDLGVDEWFKWSNKVKKGNTHNFFVKKVCFLPIVCVGNFYNKNRIFSKKSDLGNGACTDTRVSVHALLRGGHQYAG